MGKARAASSNSAYLHAYKLFEPRALQGAISREELLARMFGPQAARVVLIQGPAGHGKSTLLQQAMAACRARGMVAGWLALDEADNDLRRLSMHLHALLVAMDDTLEADERGTLPKPEELGSRAEGLIQRLLAFSQPVALFLDDFHALTQRPVMAFFKDLLEHLPDPVRLFIGSRSVPDIGLARQVVNNQALVIRADDLRFSQSEVRRFFAAAQDLHVAEDELKAIYRKTEGWPAALQLFRLSLSSPSVRRSLTDVGSHRPRELADYLADNVLALQSPEIQAFLLRTSPLLRLSGPLCDEILDRQDSQAMLLQLERAGLFVRSLDSDLRWFGYHALFADFLAEQLRVDSPELLRDIHLRAAAWFMRHEAYEEAIQHAAAGADYSLAADVLDVWSSRLIALGHLVTVERWYETLPLDQVGKRPDLVVRVAWALCFLRRHQKLKPILNLLRPLRGRVGKDSYPDVVASMLTLLDDDIPNTRDIVAALEIDGQSPSGFRAFELGAAANLRAYLHMAEGDLERAHQDLIMARAYGDRGRAGFSLGYSVSMQGMNLMIRGQLPQAIERMREGLAQPWVRLDESVSSAAIAACYVQALYEAGDIVGAEAQFDQAQDGISNFALLDYVCVAFVAMSRIHDLHGRSTQALEVLDQADSIGHARLWPRLVHQIGWERVRRLLLRGELDRARAAASRFGASDNPVPTGWIMFSEDTEGDQIGQIRLALFGGDVEKALSMIGGQLATAQLQGRVKRQVKLGTLEAVAYHRRGSEGAAQRSLMRALQLAQPGGLLRCVLDEGRDVLLLLKRAYEIQAGTALMEPGARELQGFIARLLDAAGEDVRAAQSPEFQALEPLTEREKKILILLANAVSNEEMAQRLFVSKNTIKFHLKNIYAKLAVSSRYQAINAARAMGLVR
ncbi:MAG: LuxR C-terminal-related transcriptional regulator [Panacagrimonas sp.]